MSTDALRARQAQISRPVQPSSRAYSGCPPNKHMLQLQAPTAAPLMPYLTHMQPPARDSRLRRRARGPCCHNERLKPGGTCPECSTTKQPQRLAASVRLAAAVEQRAQPACGLHDAALLADSGGDSSSRAGQLAAMGPEISWTYHLKVTPGSIVNLDDSMPVAWFVNDFFSGRFACVRD